MVEKLTTTVKCPGCGAVCQGEKWQSNGRIYEDIVCKTCTKSWGRIDGCNWLDMSGLFIPSQVAEQIHKGVKA